MLFYPSLFPPPQRDKVKECCISTSNSIQVCCHSLSFQAPLSYVSSLMPFSFPCAPTFAAKRVNFCGGFICVLCLFAWCTMSSLISVHVNPLFYPNLFAEERKRRRSKPTIPAFQFLIFLSPESGEENGWGNATTVSGVNTQASSSALSLLTPLPHTLAPPLLPLACYSGLSVQSSGL